MSEYCEGLIDTGLSRLPSKNDTIVKNLSYQGSIATHSRLLTYGRQVLHRIIGDARIHAVAAATLLHRNFHKRNIFISKEDPTVFTDIVDWQSSCVKSTLEYGDTVPDFLGYNPNASDEERLADKEAEICQKAYDVSVKFRTPELAAARVLDHDFLRQFRYCHRTWHDGAPAYRQDLIDLAGRWKKLDLPGSCPYPLPTSEEMNKHEREFKEFEEVQDIRHQMVSLLDVQSDGWVPINRWESVQYLHKMAFEEALSELRKVEAVEGQPISEEKFRTMWPFDIA